MPETLSNFSLVDRLIKIHYLSVLEQITLQLMKSGDYFILYRKVFLEVEVIQDHMKDNVY